MSFDYQTPSWAPVDLSAVVAGVQSGAIVGPVPTLMSRTDGPCLLYPGEVHSLAGEPESGKGWITLGAATAIVAGGQTVLYLDFEDAPASIVTRLLALGVEPDSILERFVYVRPSEPFSGPAFQTLVTAREYALAVIDGLSEAYALLGLEINSNDDAAKFLAAIPRRLADHGAAVIEIDHVGRDKEARGRYAIGAQHKLAGVAVAYRTDVIKTPSRTAAGLTKLKVEKDRHGHVRGHAQAGVIALARITPANGGELVTVTLEPPDSAVGEATSFRPTNLMEKVSRFLEAEPGASLNAIRRGVTGKGEWIDTAVRVLIGEGFVERRPEGRAQRHYVIAKYRETTDRVHVSLSRPDRVPDTVNGTVSRVPSPLGGTRPDTVTLQRQTATTVSHHKHDADSELQRIAAKFGDDA